MSRCMLPSKVLVVGGFLLIINTRYKRHHQLLKMNLWSEGFQIDDLFQNVFMQIYDMSSIGGGS